MPPRSANSSTLKRKRSSPPPKRLETTEAPSASHLSEADDGEDELDGEEVDDDDISSDDGEQDSEGTEEDIAAQKSQKSRKTKKRKHRATSPTTFGAALTNLLSIPTPSAEPLSVQLSASNRAREDEKLEKRAREIIKVQRKDKEEVGHVVDVIGGWGAEGERGLRKVAQRGVVKLFNAIQTSQALSNAQSELKQSARGTGKPSLPAPDAEDFTNVARKRKKGKDNVIGRAKEVDLSKEGFLAVIRGD